MRLTPFDAYFAENQSDLKGVTEGILARCMILLASLQSCIIAERPELVEPSQERRSGLNKKLQLPPSWDRY
jgi:hypothetical protein